MKKEVENKKSSIIVLSCSESSSDESEKELPKINKEELKNISKLVMKITSLDYSKRKNNKYMVEYKGKKIHFGSVNTEDFIIHKDPDRRDKYRVKAMKITNKDGELTYQLPTYPNYWSVKLVN